MVMTEVQMLDLFFRFAAVGQLILLVLLLWRSKVIAAKAATNTLLLCCIAYILLTAPVDDVHYGWLRPPLLLFTDLTAYALLAVYWQAVHHKSLLSQLSGWLKVMFSLWLVWLCYFFLLLQGKGLFHDVHHAILLLVLVFVVINAFIGLSDDLVERRRRLRIAIIAAGSVYMGLLTLLEFSPLAIKDNMLFSSFNAGLLFAVTTVIAVCRLAGFRSEQQTKVAEPIKQIAASEVHSESAEAKQLKSKMAAGLYRINGLNISQLAAELGIPVYQLRQLINVELGFDNFSHFINSYRIPAVCARLADPKDNDKPVLTLALDAGFNSIAPFNRVFKQSLGMTPSQYRAQF
ncbi:AraC family transcriptional regulator [Rheinheimera hassiensis]|uniref:AraC family transcriptional regulator n=1 Tax=Rheinheimera hassiensis TaxID=1193627 RepID=UPI001F054F06|nr:helix-turn-helix domain-containing protein [Rheinheimera hassiensis]